MKELYLYDLITSQRPQFLIPSHWELEFQHMNFEGPSDHSDHSSYARCFTYQQIFKKILKVIFSSHPFALGIFWIKFHSVSNQRKGWKS